MVIFSAEALCRAINVTVVPLLAYQIFGSAGLVAAVLFAATATALATNLVMPSMLRLVPRRVIFTLGMFAYVLCSVLYLVGTETTQAAAMVCQAIAVALVESTLTLYLLDHIPRRELGSFEPTRIFLSGVIFITSPFIGVLINEQIFFGTSFLVTIVVAILTVSYFWRMRLSTNEAFKPARNLPKNPLASIPRFIRQRRLVVAWALSAGRVAFWAGFYTFPAIFLASTGMDKTQVGAIVSISIIPVMLSPIYGRLANIIGLRVQIQTGFLGGAVSMAVMTAAAYFEQPVFFAAGMIGAAFFILIVDSAGNTPFLRAIHYYERDELTPIYSTYRQLGALGITGVSALLSLFFPTWTIFAAMTASAIFMWGLAFALPKSL